MSSLSRLPKVSDARFNDAPASKRDQAQPIAGLSTALSTEEPPGGEGLKIDFARLLQFPLEFDKVPKRPMHGSIILCICIVSGISALVVWGMASGAKKIGDETVQVNATVPSNAAARSSTKAPPLVQDLPSIGNERPLGRHTATLPETEPQHPAGTATVPVTSKPSQPAQTASVPAATEPQHPAGTATLPVTSKPSQPAQTASVPAATEPQHPAGTATVPVTSKSSQPAQTASVPAPTEPQHPAGTATVPAAKSLSLPPTSSPVVLSDDEIATLIKRGKDYIATGNIAAARLLLRRAAEAGSADAAYGLGASFDSSIIQRLGLIGVQPDNDLAQKWYQRAAELGSTKLEK